MNYTRNQGRQNVKSKFIIAFIAFAIIIGAKAISSKSSEKKTIHVSIID